MRHRLQKEVIIEIFKDVQTVIKFEKKFICYFLVQILTVFYRRFIFLLIIKMNEVKTPYKFQKISIIFQLNTEL